MKTHLYYSLLFFVAAFSFAQGIFAQESFPFIDSASVNRSTPDQSRTWTTALDIKNQNGSYCKLAMMKADLSNLTTTVTNATFSFYVREGILTLHVYGVKDSSGFQDWVGNTGGDASWNNVISNGLFNASPDYYLQGDTNTVEIGTAFINDATGGNVKVELSGPALVDLLNDDTDGLVTFVFAMEEDENAAIRPHTHSDGPELIVNKPSVRPLISPQNGTNVLFIAIDDFKPLLGCYGDTTAITPEVDKLADRGVTFLNAHCQWAICGASRASIMTGLMPEQTGVFYFEKMRSNASHAFPNLVTLPQHFRQNGYRTVATGKVNDSRCVGELSASTNNTYEVINGSKDDPPSWGDPVNPNMLPADYFNNTGYAGGGSSVVDSPTAYCPEKDKVLTHAATSIDAPDNHFIDGSIADIGVDLISNLATNDCQFFLAVGFQKPHLPFLAPKKYWDLYERDQFTPHPYQIPMTNSSGYAFNSILELRGSYYLATNSVGEAIALTTNVLPVAQQQELLHGYYASASFVDAQVGRLLDELEAQGLSSNTIVVVWGDHGWHLGDYNEWGKHTYLEQATRVPLIIHNPFSSVSGTKTTSPAGLIDLFPTLCELAGLAEPQQPITENEDPFTPPGGRPLAGKSLVPILEDPAATVQEGVMSHYRVYPYGYSYRTEQYRYVEIIKPGNGERVATELYDLVNDPMGTVNLANEPGYEGIVYQLSRSMRAAGESGGCEILHTTTPAPALSPNLTLPISLDNNTIQWPRSAGVTWNVLSTPHLEGAAWTTNQSQVITNSLPITFTEQKEFFKVEVVQ